MSIPITFDDVLAAEQRIRPFLAPTPLRTYAPLDALVGRGIRVFVKHENHQPTNAFKVRNAFSVMTRLSEAERRRGVVAATRGNHGLGLAYVGARFQVPVTICVPVGNNPEKNEAMRGYGARLIEEGRDYDEAAGVADRLVHERGLRLVHSTNDRDVIAGAATISLEIFNEAPALDALVVAVGGGSQAVGAIVAARARAPSARIYGVQAARAAAIHDSWHAGRPLTTDAADTFADGLASRRTYELTFDALREGLAGFVTVTEDELADAVRLVVRTTHTLVEGAGAAGVAGLVTLGDQLAGARVGVILSGANIDQATVRRVFCHRVPAPRNGTAS